MDQFSGGGSLSKVGFYLFAICAAVIPISACQTNQTASKEAIQRAYTSLGNCIYRAIPKLDDGKSSARAVGAMALTRCRKEELWYLQLESQGHSLEVANAYRQGFQVSRIENPTAAVLELRNKNEATARSNKRLISKWPYAVNIGIASWRAIECGQKREETIAAANSLLIKKHPHVQFALNKDGKLNVAAMEVLSAIKLGADKVKQGDLIACDRALSNWRKLVERR